MSFEGGIRNIKASSKVPPAYVNVSECSRNTADAIRT